MGLFKKVTSFLRREAEDVGDAADDLKDRFDEGLAKREAELEMTPSEKIEAIQEQADATDSRFDEILEKAEAQGHLVEAEAEVAAAEPVLPNITHIVLPDGRVKSGDEIDDRPVPPIGLPPAVPTGAAPVPSQPGGQAPSDGTEPEIGSLEWVMASDPEDRLTSGESSTTSNPMTASGAIIKPSNAPAAPPPEAPAPEPVAAPPPAAEAPLAAEAPAPEPTPAAEAQPAPEASPQPDPEVSADFGKTPAQLKYEKARAAANALLEELRGELHDDGDI